MVVNRLAAWRQTEPSDWPAANTDNELSVPPRHLVPGEQIKGTQTFFIELQKGLRPLLVSAWGRVVRLASAI